MDSFIARQPIFDIDRNVAAYELLFRDGVTNAFSFPDGSEATSRVMVNSLMSFGMKVLTGDKKAFINVTTDILVSDHLQLFSCDEVVCEILEDVQVTEEVLAACVRLKKAGFEIALDDVVARDDRADLAHVADIVKVDFRGTDRERQRELAEKYGGMGVRLLAEKVETHDEFSAAVEMGYTLFQGYFFAKPEVMRTRDIAPNELNCLMLIKLVQQHPIDFGEVERVVKQDVSLSYRLLRYINSAFFGFRVEIKSIRQAVVLLGEREFSRWATIIAMSNMAKDKPMELLNTCLTRARFLELMAPELKMEAHREELFLTGMLSLMDAVMDRTFDELLGDLPVDPRVSGALKGEQGPFLRALEGVVAYERGDWKALFDYLDSIGANPRKVLEHYIGAVEWSRRCVSETQD